MDIKIIGEHLEVTDGIKNHIVDKFKHLPHPEKLSHVEFRIGTHKNEQHVTFFARCLKEEFRLENKSGDLYSSIDMLMDKIKRSFVKFKDKNHHHMHKELM